MTDPARRESPPERLTKEEARARLKAIEELEREEAAEQSPQESSADRKIA